MRLKFKQLFKPGGSLSQRAVSGGIWVFIARISDKGLGLIRLIILARVLAPDDFGLMGIALLAMSTLATFSQTGFNAALVQTKKNIEEYLDTAWTVQIIRGMVLSGLLLATAPLVATFFDTPKATAIVRVIAITVLLQGFTNIGVVYFRKELEFNKQFIYQSSGTVADLSVAIPAALILRSVWALVFGLLAGAIVRLIMSYAIHPYRPKIQFEPGKARELFGFGKWVFGSAIVLFLLIQGDDILVGKILGVAALGFYQMAYRLSNLPATEITNVISQVTFPVYSKLQDNLPKLREAYFKTLQLTTFVAIPLATGILVLAPEFTKIFLGDKWIPIIIPLQILCIFGAIRSIGATMGSLYKSVGKPYITFYNNLVKLFVLAIIIYPLTKYYGLIGVSLAITIPTVIQLFIVTTIFSRMFKVRIVKLLKIISPYAFSSFFMGLTMFLLKNVSLKSDMLSFLLSILGGIFVYFSILKLLPDKMESFKIADLLGSKITHQ